MKIRFAVPPVSVNAKIALISGIDKVISAAAIEIASLIVPLECFLASISAISLSIIKKSKFDVIFLVEKLAKFLKECYIKYDCNFQEVLDLWKEENRLIGQIIEAVTPTGEAHVGVFKDILPDGAMLLEENGVEFRFDCGDIKLNTKRIDFKQLEREKKL